VFTKTEPLAPSLTHDRAIFREPAAGRENQQKGEAGGAIGQHGRRVGDDDAMLPRGFHVHVVKAGAGICDDANASRKVRGIGCRKPNLRTAEDRLTLVLGRGTDHRVRVHIDVGKHRIEFALCACRDGGQRGGRPISGA
jgi:hypothetical protein